MKISLITICYNSIDTIKETFDSVLAQDFENYEYIVIDGLSTDGTLKEIKRYSKLFLGKMRYISQKDKGLYDAMNIGLEMAKGDIVGYLNADDKFATNKILAKIYQTFKENNCDISYGDLIFLDKNTMSKSVRKVLAGEATKFSGWHPPHPTLYIKKKVYEEIGNFNIKYKIAADYDFMLRLFKQNYNIFYIKETLIHMRAGGLSTRGFRGYYENFCESYLVLKDHKVKFPLFINLIRVINTLKQILWAKIVNK